MNSRTTSTDSRSIKILLLCITPFFLTIGEGSKSLEKGSTIYISLTARYTVPCKFYEYNTQIEEAFPYLGSTNIFMYKSKALQEQTKTTLPFFFSIEMRRDHFRNSVNVQFLLWLYISEIYLQEACIFFNFKFVQ